MDQIDKLDIALIEFRNKPEGTNPSSIVSGEFIVSPHQPGGWRPPTDVFETAEHIEVRIEIPGVDEADFRVTFTKNLLRISGDRRDTQPKSTVHQMEINYGTFISDVYIGIPVLKDLIEARYTQGFLHVILPKDGTTQEPRS